MATIKDIALSLGISRGTVDRALHNREGVSKEVKDLVLKKAEELGYKSNKAGRMLSVLKKPKKIGVLLPICGNAFFDDVLKGMEKAELEYKDIGFSIDLYSVTGFKVENHIEAIKSLLSRGADALVLTTVDDPKMIEFLEKVNIPIITVNTDIALDKKLFYVGPDYREKGAINAGLLSLCGHKKYNILILHGSEKVKGHREIVSSFIDGLDERGVDYKISAECRGEDDENLSYKLVSSALERNPEIDTLFVATAGAAGAIKAVANKKILFFASDEVDIVKELVLNGKIAWTVSQEPFVQGYEAIKRTCEYFINPYSECSSYITKHVIKLKENIRG